MAQAKRGPSVLERIRQLENRINDGAPGGTKGNPVDEAAGHKGNAPDSQRRPQGAIQSPAKQTHPQPNVSTPGASNWVQFSGSETTEDVEIVRGQEMRPQSTPSHQGVRPTPSVNGPQVATNGAHANMPSKVPSGTGGAKPSVPPNQNGNSPQRMVQPAPNRSSNASLEPGKGHAPAPAPEGSKPSAPPNQNGNNPQRMVQPAPNRSSNTSPEPGKGHAPAPAPAPEGSKPPAPPNQSGNNPQRMVQPAPNRSSNTSPEPGKGHPSAPQGQPNPVQKRLAFPAPQQQPVADAKNQPAGPHTQMPAAEPLQETGARRHSEEAQTLLHQQQRPQSDPKRQSAGAHIQVTATVERPHSDPSQQPGASSAQAERTNHRLNPDPPGPARSQRAESRSPDPPSTSTQDRRQSRSPDPPSTLMPPKRRPSRSPDPPSTLMSSPESDISSPKAHAAPERGLPQQGRGRSHSSVSVDGVAGRRPPAHALGADLADVPAHHRVQRGAGQNGENGENGEKGPPRARSKSAEDVRSLVAHGSAPPSQAQPGPSQNDSPPVQKHLSPPPSEQDIASRSPQRSPPNGHAEQQTPQAHPSNHRPSAPAASNGSPPSTAANLDSPNGKASVRASSPSSAQNASVVSTSTDADASKQCRSPTRSWQSSPPEILQRRADVLGTRSAVTPDPALGRAQSAFQPSSKPRRRSVAVDSLGVVRISAEFVNDGNQPMSRSFNAPQKMPQKTERRRSLIDTLSTDPEGVMISADLVCGEAAHPQKNLASEEAVNMQSLESFLKDTGEDFEFGDKDPMAMPLYRSENSAPDFNRFDSDSTIQRGDSAPSLGRLDSMMTNDVGDGDGDDQAPARSQSPLMEIPNSVLHHLPSAHTDHSPHILSRPTPVRTPALSSPPKAMQALQRNGDRRSGSGGPFVDDDDRWSVWSWDEMEDRSPPRELNLALVAALSCSLSHSWMAGTPSPNKPKPVTRTPQSAPDPALATRSAGLNQEPDPPWLITAVPSYPRVSDRVLDKHAAAPRNKASAGRQHPVQPHPSLDSTHKGHGHGRTEHAEPLETPEARATGSRWQGQERAVTPATDGGGDTESVVSTSGYSHELRTRSMLVRWEQRLPDAEAEAGGRRGKERATPQLRLQVHSILQGVDATERRERASRSANGQETLPTKRTLRASGVPGTSGVLQ